MTKTDGRSIVPVERIENAILFIRGHKVILDRDLAKLYGVSTKVFNQAVKRNIERFPSDFMFRLTLEENEALRSQFVTLKPGRGRHSKYLPYAFTEQGGGAVGCQAFVLTCLPSAAEKNLRDFKGSGVFS